MPPIIIPRAALLPALVAADKAVEKRNTIPILSNLLIEPDEGLVRLVATGLDVEIVAEAACDSVSGPGFTVPSAILAAAVRKMPADADVSIACEGAVATVGAGRARFRLPVLPAGDFPRMKSHDPDGAVRFSLPAADLAGMLAATRFAVSTEETRYYLNGIHLHAGEGADGPALVAVATDGHRLALTARALPEGAAGMPAVILPRVTVDLLAAITGRKADIAIELSPTRVRLAVGPGEDGPGIAITSKLVDGTFPDYRRVMPAAPPSRFTLDVAALRAAVDRVLTIAPTGKGCAVRFAFSAGGLELSAVNPDAGEAREGLAVASAEGAPVEIGINGRYMLDMLAAVPAASVTIHLSDNASPALVTCPDAPDARFVLMPMRI